MSGDGVLPIDKPPGPTSHDAVAIARRALRTRRIGHTGTLDPFASGLLLLCIGRATRLAELLTGMPKTYEATMMLGVATDTDDPTGAVVARSESWLNATDADIRASLETQRGTRMQVPPSYSAKKQGGERLYARARRGETAVADPVEVTIHEIEVVRIAPPEVDFRVTCAAGTYIRAIARDAGEALGSHAHLLSLRRSAIGPHRVEDAVPLDRIDDEDAVRAAWLDPLAAVSHLPRIEVEETGAGHVAHGRPLRIEGPKGTVCIVRDGELLAIADSDGAVIRPRRVFIDA